MTHSFDRADLPPQGIRYLGYFLRYDPAAATDAQARVRAFLSREIKGR